MKLLKLIFMSNVLIICSLALSVTLSVAVPPSAAVWSMPLCRVLWFVLNKLLSPKNRFSPPPTPHPGRG